MNIIQVLQREIYDKNIFPNIVKLSQLVKRIAVTKI